MNSAIIDLQENVNILINQIKTVNVPNDVINKTYKVLFAVPQNLPITFIGQTVDDLTNNLFRGCDDYFCVPEFSYSTIYRTLKTTTSKCAITYSVLENPSTCRFSINSDFGDKIAKPVIQSAIKSFIINGGLEEHQINTYKDVCGVISPNVYAGSNWFSYPSLIVHVSDNVGNKVGSFSYSIDCSIPSPTDKTSCSLLSNSLGLASGVTLFIPVIGEVISAILGVLSGISSVICG